ncbi:hypothetical protein LEP1GSC133_2085 [Leptospira borgpetersenii serovar Pomona str. 200901868]|uniref:Uncharacterized protein n=1 Tax=Leptospira borgpetersenii serovar Pomona str. 200901868 TaxID=1192866 RepID=M6W2W7_LEPBO|nr:hypothetical protein LEP1GSC133_2085 [Leptospira borgpetersenii serovar Pomona str. 200901868]
MQERFLFKIKNASSETVRFYKHKFWLFRFGSISRPLLVSFRQKSQFFRDDYLKSDRF